jgi:hypothetical protein
MLQAGARDSEARRRSTTVSHANTTRRPPRIDSRPGPGAGRPGGAGPGLGAMAASRSHPRLQPGLKHGASGCDFLRV